MRYWQDQTPQSWPAKLQDNYDTFGEWETYSDMYGLAERLGFDSAKAAWNANPTIQGSTDPADFKVVVMDLNAIDRPVSLERIREAYGESDYVTINACCLDLLRWIRDDSSEHYKLSEPQLSALLIMVLKHSKQGLACQSLIPNGETTCDAGQ